MDLFRKYGVLTKVELESRTHIAVEKYVKQLLIEAETMVSMARTKILPAALRHQTMMAEAVAATEAAGVKDADTVAALKEFVAVVTKLRKATAAVERASAVHLDDPMKHAQHIKAKVIPAMQELRALATSCRSTSPRSSGRCRPTGNCCS